MKAKKSLGQNFLKSEPALMTIIETGEVGPNDIVLEIGPGKGALTEKLLNVAGTVIAVEKDRELFEFLKIKFADQIKNKSFVLVSEDILNFEIKEKKYKIIANIPYNITGAILKKFLTEKTQPELMVLMVQYEVAKRIVARDAKESILSISVKAYGEPKMVMKVQKRYFAPAPKVDSAIISIKNISRRLFTENKLKEEKFWGLVKTGFAHKRKKLSGNLKELASQEGFENFTLGENLKNKRAEDLSLLEWITLAKD